MRWEYILTFIVLYTIIATIIKHRKLLPDYVNISGPILTIRSQRGLNTIENLANNYNWGLWGNIGVISAIITGIIGAFFVVTSIIGIILEPNEVALQGPSDMVVIPGVNRFLPLSAAPELILGLTIGMIVHEGGHAIYCRVGDINIKSTGVIFGALIPLGAFVEPDEESSKNADVKSQLRMYAAGIMNNYAVFAVSLVLLFVFVGVLVSPVIGIGVSTVLTDSPAEKMGLSEGDVITAVDNETIESNDEFNNYLSNNAQTITLDDGRTLDIPKGAYVSQTPQSTNLNIKDTIISVNGYDVKNPSELEKQFRNISDTHADIKLSDGNSATVPIGVYATAQENTGIATDMNLDMGESTYIFEINNERVYNGNDVIDKIDNRENDNISITYLDAEENVVTTNTTYDSNDNSITMSNMISGVGTSVLGINIYPADSFHDILTIDNSIVGNLQNILLIVLLPLASLAPMFEANFPGFTPMIQNFYTMSPIVPEFAVGIMFFGINVLFWSAWINFNLALFNCIPTFALDGGHILRAMSEMILGDYASESTIKWFVRTIQMFLLLCLLFIIFIPILL